MKLTRVYHQGRVFGYVPQDVTGCVAVLQVAEGSSIPDEEIEAGAFFRDYWLDAARHNGERRSSIAFYPPESEGVHAEGSDFAELIDRNGFWDQFHYWKTADPRDRFESVPGQSVVLKVGHYRVEVIDAADPRRLSQLDCAWEGESLRLSSRAGQWRAFDLDGLTISRADNAYVDFSPADKEWPGSIRFDVLKNVFEQLPVNITYNSVETDDDDEPEEFFVKPRISAAVFRGLDSESMEGASLCLDARDDRWEKKSRSRVEFRPGTRIVTNLISEKGARLVCESLRGVARLSYLVTGGVVDEGKWESPTARSAGFVPQGDFRLVGLEGVSESSIDPTRSLRVLVGASPTESIELSIGDHLTFEIGKGAVFRDGGPEPLPNETEATEHYALPLHSANEFVTTSWMTVNRVRASEPAFLSSEASSSPLFESVETAGSDAPLERVHLRFEALKPIPFFPWVGLTADGSERASLADNDRKFPTEETQFLGPSRRLTLRPMGEMPSEEEALDDSTAPASKLAVTPQGLIAQVTGVDYTKLFLGNPDPQSGTLHSNGPTVPPLKGGEFYISISNGDQRVHRDIQRALRAEDLFLVFWGGTEAARKVFRPATDLMKLGSDFSFSFGITGADESDSESSTQSRPLLLKYFRGRRLSELIKHPSTWACSDDLAPVPDGSTREKMIEQLQKLAEMKEPASDADELTKAVYEAWHTRVWDNPDWQGVVALDVDLSGAPTIFEALGAGISTLSKFRFHHVGLDYLPFKRKDLESATDPDPAPERQGSAFALLRYDGSTDDDQVINSGDTDPMEPGDDEPRKTPESGYRFKVNTITVLLVKSELVGFDTRAELGFQRFLGDRTAGDLETRAVAIIGAHESRKDAQGRESTIFKLIVDKALTKTITFTESWLEKLEITQGDLTIRSASDETGERVVSFFVGFDATLDFDPTKQPLRELFKVENITLERVGIAFEYRPHHPKEERVSCKFDAEGAGATITPGSERVSFLSGFPLKFKAFRFALARVLDLDALGFVKVSGGISAFHFGFEFEMDFGALGALSGVGKDMKLPVLVGWRRGKADGGFCCGIQFPEWNRESFQLGFQGFVGIRADGALFKPCRDDSGMTGLAIVLTNAQLMLFGKTMPDDTQIDVGLFIPTQAERRFAWVFGAQFAKYVKYLGVGRLVRIPQKNDAVSIVDEARSYLSLKRNKPDEPAGPEICDLFAGDLHDPNRAGWLVVGELELGQGGMVHAWMALADSLEGGGSLYALHLKIVGFLELGATYRRINDDLGVFSAELALSESIPPLQFGAATVRLPSIRTEVYTDGGWLVDLGFPWQNDFRRSFQMEVGIFLGSGGVYFGYVLAASVDTLMLKSELVDGDRRFLPPDLNHGSLNGLRAIRAGIALRVGIGRSIDLGILKGEASLSIYGSLEGAVAFTAGVRDLRLYYVKGAVGLMVHIWAELDFFVLQARAEIVAYVEVGFVVQRVFALDVSNGHCNLKLPTLVYAEVGIYVRFELWITIGCIRVKICDLEFKATWRVEEKIGSVEPVPVDADRDSLSAGAGFELPRLVPPKRLEWGRAPSRESDALGAETIRIYVMMLPCAVDPVDLGRSSTLGYQECLVSHLMLDESTGFASLGKFMTRWALQVHGNTDVIDYESVRRRRKELSTAVAWGGNLGARLIQEVRDQFTPELVTDPTTWATNVEIWPVALPAWPDLTWKFVDKPDNPETLMALSDGGVATEAGSLTGVTQDNVFVDYLRLITMSLLDEIETLLRIDFKKGSTKWVTIRKRIFDPTEGTGA